MFKPLQTTTRDGARVYWNIPKNEARLNLPDYACRLDINICTVNNFYAFHMDLLVPKVHGELIKTQVRVLRKSCLGI